MTIENPITNSNATETQAEQLDPVQCFRKLTNEYIEKNPEIMSDLNKSSQKAGLEEVMISTHCNQISTNEIWKGYVFFHPDCLENHKIIFDIDKKFANKGSFLVM